MVPVQFPVNMISTWAGSFQHTDEISHAGSLYLLYSLSALIFKDHLLYLILNAQVRSMWQFSQNSYVLAARWANYDSVSMGTRCLVCWQQVCFPGFECIQQMLVHQWGIINWHVMLWKAFPLLYPFLFVLSIVDRGCHFSWGKEKVTMGWFLTSYKLNNAHLNNNKHFSFFIV